MKAILRNINWTYFQFWFFRYKSDSSVSKIFEKKQNIYFIRMDDGMTFSV